MNSQAERYVKLALALGKHDELYVDAYYGPEEWKSESSGSLSNIEAQAHDLRSGLTGSDPRSTYLAKQVDSLIARCQMTQGIVFPFDEESKKLYDVVAPHREDGFYANVGKELDPMLPGQGSIGERYEQFRSQFVIPPDKVDAVFQAAIDEARRRTKAFIDLQSDESFRLEYVTGEVWSAYNWYQGNASSLIQINLDLPITVDRAIGLACHEGYPGHHVYNALLERHLMRDKGWLEFSVYPLYSPQSLIAEGTAEFGVGLCFNPQERHEFETSVLYPLAGLDPSLADDFRRVLNLMGNLGYAGNDCARRYLDGEWTRQQAIDWLVEFTYTTPERAAQRLRFIEAHRSYVVTYNVGEDLVRDYVGRHAKTEAERWDVFAKLLSTPQVPSNLLN